MHNSVSTENTCVKRKYTLTETVKGEKQPHPPLEQWSLPPRRVGLFFPLYGFCKCILSLNACVFCRYTIMHYIVSVYMQVADCTIGFLLYLDALTLGGLHSFRVPSFIQGLPQNYIASPWTQYSYVVLVQTLT